MGFNKRMITKELVMGTSFNEVDKLFECDAIVFDNWSFKFYQLYKSGLSKDSAIKLLQQEI